MGEKVRIGYGRPSGSLKSGRFLSHTQRDSPAPSPTPASASDTASPPDHSPTADSASHTASPTKKQRMKHLPIKAEVSDSPEPHLEETYPVGLFGFLTLAALVVLKKSTTMEVCYEAGAIVKHPSDPVMPTRRSTRNGAPRLRPVRRQQPRCQPAVRSLSPRCRRS